jgi:glucose-1-phosphate thymidylyltransferase
MVKGIIMGAGKGQRLLPITKVVNKHLLPIYDKPMIYYPLTTLILAGIKEILIVVNAKDIDQYKELLGDGSALGINVEYLIQLAPKGIAQGIVLAKSFIKSDNFMLLLGDNLFYGKGLGRSLRDSISLIESGNKGSVIFTQEVPNPEEYGIIELDSTENIISIQEKPMKSKSKLAISGLYIFDNKALDYANQLQPSTRGELEIIDVLKHYWLDNTLKVTQLDLGVVWLDTGTFKNLNDAAEFVRIIQDKQSISVGDPYKAAKTIGLI